MNGAIILGHGSRAKEANDALLTITDMVKEKLEFDIIEPAYLQLCEPGLKETVEKMAEQGAKKIVIMPLFLFRGIHIQEDVPLEVAKLKEEYAGKIEFTYAAHLGTDQRIADIAVDRIREVSLRGVC